MERPLTAQEHVGLGNQCLDDGRLAEAMSHFQEARALAPEWSVPAYNVGLVAKFQKDWPLSLEANWAAFRLHPDDQATQWNLSIAACALGDWEKAGEGFRAIGMRLPEGEGPWDLGLGLTPVRLDPEGSAEVVWGRRLDPCRVLVRNVPMPSCNHRYGDVVLIDGAPAGTRVWRGREYSVHNALKLLSASDYTTHEFTLEVDSEQSLSNLEATLSEHGVFMEDWTSSLRMLCKACSEGRPHESHDHELAEEHWKPERRLALALPPEVSLEIVRSLLLRQGLLLQEP